MQWGGVFNNLNRQETPSPTINRQTQGSLGRFQGRPHKGWLCDVCHYSASSLRDPLCHGGSHSQHSCRTTWLGPSLQGPWTCRCPRRCPMGAMTQARHANHTLFIGNRSLGGPPTPRRHFRWITTHSGLQVPTLSHPHLADLSQNHF